MKEKDAANRKALLQAWFSKYLPSVCYLKIDSSTAESMKSSLNNTSTTKRDAFIKGTDSDYDLKDGDEILGSLQVTFALTTEEGGGAGEAGRTYESKKIGAGSVWAPMDRAVTKSAKPAFDEENFLESTYWVTENNDGETVAKPAGDALSDLKDDATYDTPLKNDDYGKAGEKEVISDEDAPVTMITVGNLTTEKGAVIDLSYANTKDNPGNEDERPFVQQYNDRMSGSGTGQLDFEYEGADDAREKRR